MGKPQQEMPEAAQLDYSIEKAISFYEQPSQLEKLRAVQHKRAILRRLSKESILTPKEMSDIRAIDLNGLGIRLMQFFSGMRESSMRVHIGRAKKAIREFLQAQTTG